MKKIIAACSVLLALVATSGSAQDTEPVSAQTQVLTRAYEIAKEAGLQNPELLQAVLLQETHAGALKTYRVMNPGKNAYYGLGQIKLGTARDVLRANPSLYSKYGFQTRTNDEILAHLILDDEFNIEIAARYLVMLQKQYGFKGRTLLNAYNRGPSGVRTVGDDWHYAIAAKQKLAEYKQSL
jgi:hypothetical protein